VLFVGGVVIVILVNFPVPGVVYPIFTLSIDPSVVGLMLNIPVFEKLTADNIVNAPVDGVVLPIAMLLIEPTVLDVIVTALVELIVTEPFVKEVFPLTVKLVSVPTDVRLLLTIVLGYAVPPSTGTPFTLKSPVILILP
jgi:hypothetical protein